MDRWIGSEMSFEDEIIEEAKYESVRDQTGEDVLTPAQLNS